ncbi:hypothetical protein MASR1M45_04770 [Candidatus Kapaibacterium sp.]
MNNSPLIWSDPSGLAPEKERDREKLLNIKLDDFSDGYYFGIWTAQEIERYNGMTNYWNDIFSGLDATFGRVMNWKDAFNTNFGSTSSGSNGRTAEGKGAENGIRQLDLTN